MPRLLRIQDLDAVNLLLSRLIIEMCLWNQKKMILLYYQDYLRCAASVLVTIV